MGPQLIFLGLSLCLLVVPFAVQGEYCYSDDPNKYFLFASKTAYEFARETDVKEDVPGCTPLQVWWMNRHGTRYPGKQTVASMEKLWDLRDAIIRNKNDRYGQMCDADLDALREWRLDVNESISNNLTPAGEEELQLLAGRLRERFPAAFERKYSARWYQFRHTDTQRTLLSAGKFAEGLFGKNVVVLPPPLKDDKLIQPYASCKEWLALDKKEPEEYVKLVQGPEGIALVKAISDRLGFLGPLKFDDVNTMYDMCRYDKAWDLRKLSPWCSVFTKEQLEFMEYLEDLRYYYKSGYGDDMSVKLGCPMAKDMLERFRPLAEGTAEQPSGIFYFGHSSGLHMLQSRLGVYRPAQPLTAANREQQRNRSWRVSQMGPFAGNLGAIFYRCRADNSSQVLFLGSERPIDVEGCHLGLCSWERVRDLLEPIAEQCNLDWCEGEGNGATSALTRSFAVALVCICATVALLSPLLRIH